MNFDYSEELSDTSTTTTSDTDEEGETRQTDFEHTKRGILLRLQQLKEEGLLFLKEKRQAVRKERMLRRVTAQAQKALQREAVGVAEATKRCKCGIGKRNCRVCLRERYDADPVGFMGHRLITEARKRCMQKEVEINIDVHWVRNCFEHQKGLCALCGQKMTLHDPRLQINPEPRLTFMRFPSNLSIDQREPSRGYTNENAQLVHLRCNIAKLDMTQEEFISMCRSVAAFQQHTTK